MRLGVLGATVQISLLAVSVDKEGGVFQTHVKNGGSCIEDTYNFRCSCTPQYSGNTCGVRRWCIPDPCQNGGTCTEEAHKFTCTCPPQFTGDTCAQAVRCIPNPCQNDGTCTERPLEFNITEGSNCTRESGFKLQ